VKLAELITLCPAERIRNTMTVTLMIGYCSLIRTQHVTQERQGYA